MLAIDHFVFPVTSLDEVLSTIGNYGFTLAPKAIHPFGTANICLFLKGDVYIEFLSMHDEEIYAQSLTNEYSFIRDIDNWHNRNGDRGFSSLAFASKDARADHARFESLGISGGRMGEFSREFALADGTTDIASFRTVHTHLPTMPEIICFTCQRVRAPAVDRSLLEKHANETNGLKKIIIAAPAPLEIRKDLTVFLGGPPSLAIPDALEFTLPNAKLIALTPDRIRHDYGIRDFALNKTEAITTPRLVGLEFTTSSLSLLKEQFLKTNLSYTTDLPFYIHHPLPEEDIFWAFRQS